MGEPIRTVGDLAGLCGHDGTNWEKVLIDATKRLVVAITACALPTGAATSANQTTMITALQLIDDLRNALDSVGTDELDVNVENSLQVRLDDHVVAEYSDVPGDTNWHDLVNVSGAGTLEWFHFGENYSSGVARITVDGGYLYMADPIGLTNREELKAIYVSLGNQEDSLFKLMVIDAVNYRWWFRLTRPIWFGSSLRIEYKAGDNTASVVTAAGYHLR